MRKELVMPRNIAVVAYSAPPHSAGGVAAAHFNLFQALREAGHDARLFTFGEPDFENGAYVVRNGTPQWLGSLLLKINGRVFELLQPGKKAYQTVDIFKSLVGAWRMNREISAFNPDVIILSDHGAPGLMLRKPRGTKVILVSHHNPARFASHPEFKDFSQLDSRWAIKLEQKMLRRVDVVVCPSEYMKGWFERSYRFLGPVVVIPNLLDRELLDRISVVDVREQLGMKPEDVLIYMPSAGNRIKGAQYVLQIIRGLNAQRKETIGFYIPGSVIPEVVDKLAELPENVQVCLAGQMPYGEHIANMKSCSFGISPSLIENYSMALLEAVNCGVPMVAFATGGNADIIHDGKNGYLISEGEIDSLIDSARRLLESPSLGEFKRKAQAYSWKNLSAGKALDSYLELVAAQ